MNRQIRIVGFGLALVSIVGLLLACGATPEPALVAPGEVREQVVVEATMVVEAAPTMAPAATAAPAAQTGNGSGLAAPSMPRIDRMIIKNAEIDLLVADTDVALDGVTLIVGEYGGYIVGSHTWFEAEHKFATVRMGVPVEEFENVLRRLRGLAIQVQNEIASGEDVTDQFVDLQSRLTNLQATRDRIREFLDQAQTVDEALKVNEQLSQVEGQIEEIQGRMNYLQDRAAFSTIDVQLNPDVPTPTPTFTPTPTPTPTPAAWQPGKTVKRASGTLASLVKGLVDLGIWVVVLLGPFLLPVGLVIGLVVWQRRRARPGPPPRPPDAA